MKLLGFILLLSGWGIVVAAVSMLHETALATFILAALATLDLVAPAAQAHALTSAV